MYEYLLKHLNRFKIFKMLWVGYKVYHPLWYNLKAYQILWHYQRDLKQTFHHDYNIRLDLYISKKSMQSCISKFIHNTDQIINLLMTQQLRILIWTSVLYCVLGKEAVDLNNLCCSKNVKLSLKSPHSFFIHKQPCSLTNKFDIYNCKIIIIIMLAIAILGLALVNSDTRTFTPQVIFSNISYNMNKIQLYNIQDYQNNTTYLYLVSVYIT